MTARESGRERDTEREGGGLEREVWPYVLTERERDRQTETDWHTETDRQTDRDIQRQTDREGEVWPNYVLSVYALLVVLSHLLGIQ